MPRSAAAARLTMLSLFSLACTTVKMPDPRDTARADGDGASGAISETSSAAPESTVVRFSQALAIADSATLQKLATPGFRLIDNGRLYDLPATLSSARATLTGATMQRSPHDLYASRRGDVAWVRYQVRGLLQGRKAPITFNRVESAVVVRDSSAWRLALMTSTPDSSND